METLPPPNPEENSEPKEEGPSIQDFESSIDQDRYNGTIQIKDSLLLDVAPRLQSLLSEIHRGMYRNIWQKYGSYNRISRSSHVQLMKIVEQYAADLSSPALSDATVAAIEEARKIEAVCELRMAAWRENQRGNLTYVEKIDPKPKKKKASNW